MCIILCVKGIYNKHSNIIIFMTKRICLTQVAEVQTYGVDLAVLGIDNNDASNVFLGKGKTRAFLESKTTLFSELYDYLNLGKISILMYTIIYWMIIMYHQLDQRLNNDAQI